MQDSESIPARHESALPIISGYTLKKHLGSGKSADSYLAIQDCFDREVTIKLMHASLKADTSFKKRFLEKIQKVKKLNQTSLTAIYAAGESDGRVYVAQEYFSQGHIGQKIKQNSALEPSEIVTLFKQIIPSLTAGHEQGIIHGNLHANKIYMRNDGSFILNDYALARAKIKGQIYNQISHISPEQLQAKPASKAVDYYALGIVLHHALTGQLPFIGNNNKEIATKHLKQSIPELPNKLSSFQPLLQHLLAKNPNQRIQSAEELIKELDQAMASYENHTVAPETKSSTQNLEKETVTENETSFETEPEVDKLQLHSHDNFEPTAHNTALNINTEAPDLNKPRPRDHANKLRADINDRNSQQTQKPQRNNTVIIASIALIGVFIITVCSIYLAPQITPSNTVLMSLNKQLMSLFQQEEEETPVEALPIIEIVKEPIDPQAQRIQRLLEKADELMALESYVSPIGNNAYGKYLAIKELEINNGQAETGINKIASIFVAKAADQMDKNRLQQAEESLQQAKAINKDAAGLIEAEVRLKEKRKQRALAQAEATRKAQAKAAQEAAKKRLQALEAKAKLQRLAEAEKLRLEAQAEEEAKRKAKADSLTKLRIKGLLAKADTYFKRGEYHSPAHENALEKYLQVSALEPANTVALQGIKNVVDTMLPEIEQFLQQQQYSMAKNLYDQAIQAAPQHAELKALGQANGW